jgi:hypothetical protein
MKIRWSFLKNCIPTHIKIKQSEYEIVWVEDFKDGKTLGETRFNTKQIVLKTNETDNETFHTYVHEVLHAVSDEYDIGLTEKQVRKLEKSLTDWLKPVNKLTETIRSINASNKRK